MSACKDGVFISSEGKLRRYSGLVVPPNATENIVTTNYIRRRKTLDSLFFLNGKPIDLKISPVVITKSDTIHDINKVNNIGCAPHRNRRHPVRRSRLLIQNKGEKLINSISEETKIQKNDVQRIPQSNPHDTLKCKVETTEDKLCRNEKKQIQKMTVNHDELKKCKANLGNNISTTSSGNNTEKNRYLGQKNIERNEKEMIKQPTSVNYEKEYEVLLTSSEERKMQKNNSRRISHNNSRNMTKLNVLNHEYNSFRGEHNQFKKIALTNEEVKKSQGYDFSLGSKKTIFIAGLDNTTKDDLCLDNQNMESFTENHRMLDYQKKEKKPASFCELRTLSEDHCMKPLPVAHGTVNFKIPIDDGSSCSEETLLKRCVFIINDETKKSKRKSKSNSEMVNVTTNANNGSEVCFQEDHDIRRDERNQLKKITLTNEEVGKSQRHDFSLDSQKTIYELVFIKMINWKAVYTN